MKLQFKMKMRLLMLLMTFFGGVTGRTLFTDDFSSSLPQQINRRKLHQFIGNCSKGSDQILTEYPSVVSLRNPIDEKEPNVNVLCGGVLLSTDTILTSAGCIWAQVEKGIPFNLAMSNLVNRTIDMEFNVAISPYCTHGDGAELGEILGYHFMEDDYNGYPRDGNAVAVLELKSNVTSLTDEELPLLRQNPIPTNTVLTMVGHGATNNEQAQLRNLNYSGPPKIINYITISNKECEQLLSFILNENRRLDGKTEACAVVQQEGSEVGICNGDDGNPLFDSDGNIAGIVTYWDPNICDQPKDRTMPIVFADVTKQKVQEFINQTETESLYFPPNITDGCGDNQTLDEAPWSVSIQFPRGNDPTQYHYPTQYHHSCGGALIDNGTKIITAAQCLWDQFFPLPDSQRKSRGVQTFPFDLRDPARPYKGKIPHNSTFVSLAPRCRHFNGLEERSMLQNYYIHPEYNGDPKAGYNIAIVTLDQQFPADQSFPNFQEFLESIGERDPPESDFEDVVFYSWGAEFTEEAREDETGFFNNYFPAKEVQMELIPDRQCHEGILRQDTSRGYVQETELCTNQPSQENFTSICTWDNGSPLVGRYINTSELVLLGVKSQLQDRQCLDAPGVYEVFTNIIEMKDFILSVLNPEIITPESKTKQEPHQESSDGDSKIIIVIVIVVIVGSFLILLIVLFAWRSIYINNRAHQAQLKKLQERKNLSNELFQLNKDIQQIHLMLGMIARKYKNPKTGKARRHSDIAASLDFMLSQEKVQTQICGYTMFFSADDSYLNSTQGVIPSSPFLLAALHQGVGVGIGPGPQNENKPMQKELINKIQNRINMAIDVKFGNTLKGLHNQNLNKGLILPETPAREDFNMEIDFEKELQVGDRLGTGAFGSVYKAYWVTRDMEVAVKIVHAHIVEQLIEDQEKGGNFLSSIVGELSLLGRIDSPFIVKCYGGSVKPPNVCLVLEYIPNGSLDQFIHSYHGQIPTGLIMRVAQGIAEGLEAIHPTIVHRDLKPQNILLDDSYRVKIVDFGLSKMKEDTYLSETMVRGTPAYIAPETFKGESVDEKCDIYALGLIIWEMVTKERPWRDQNLPVAIMARVAVKSERPPIPSNCPSELKRLIERCWAPNPRERPTAREVVQKLTILRRGQSRGSMSDHTAFMGPQQSLKKAQLSQIYSLNYSQFSIESSENSLFQST